MVASQARSTLTALGWLGLIAQPVAAQTGEWNFPLGAEFEQFLAYVSYDGATSAGFDGADAVLSGRAFMTPSFSTDMGLTFGAYLELEGHMGERNAGAEFDEASLFMRGGFGEFLIGKSDTPGNHLHAGAPAGFGPDVNFSGLSTAELPSMLQFSDVHSNVGVGDDLLRGTLGSTMVSNTGAQTQGRISYFTPSVGGFQAGASFAPYATSDNRTDFIDLGASYTGSIGPVQAAFSAKWGQASHRLIPGVHPEYWGLGMQLDLGALTFGGSYARSSGSAAGRSDGQAFDIGARYEKGRYGISLTYLNGENTDDENLALGTNEHLQALSLAASYSLTDRPARRAQTLGVGAGGVQDANLTAMQAEVFGFVTFSEFSEDVGDGGAGTQGDNVDGFAIGTGLRLAF